MRYKETANSAQLIHANVIIIQGSTNHDGDTSGPLYASTSLPGSSMSGVDDKTLPNK